MDNSLRKALEEEIASGNMDAIIREEDQEKTYITNKGAIVTDQWRAFNMADAYQERDPVKYVVGRLFERPSLNILYGSPGTLKSFLLADLLISVAAGKNWLLPAPWLDSGGQGYTTSNIPVMWLDFDNGQRRTLDRFAALGRARDLTPEIPATFYSMPTPWLISTDNASIEMLALRIKAANAGFVCVDNLGAVIGAAEENSGDMAKVMSHYRQIAEDTGAAITLIHHQRKGNGLGGRKGDTLRGHSSIEAALDLALLVEREPYADTITVTATKTRGDDVLPFRANFTYENQNGQLHKARFWGLGTDDNLSNSAISREIKEVLANGQETQTELINKVKEILPDVGVNRIRDTIKKLAKISEINEHKGEKNSNVYSI
jgi:hypothetical protein